jgi:hypothetical protein
MGLLWPVIQSEKRVWYRLCEAASLRQAFSLLFSLDTPFLRLDQACLTTLFALSYGDSSVTAHDEVR